MTGNGAQRIENWGLVTKDRVAGAVHNRPGHRDGAMIVTSPVIEIRLMGSGSWADTYPVAFTESGSVYRLGQPSKSFGVEQAEQFIHSKLTAESRPVRKDAQGFRPDQTIVRAAVDTSLHNIDRIDVYETSFKPL